MRSTIRLILCSTLLLTYWVTMIIALNWPNLNLQANAQHWPGGKDKWIHALSMFGLCFLAQTTVAVYQGHRQHKNKKRLPLAWLWMLIVVIIYGGSSELMQYYVPGRIVSAYDLLANMIGVAVGLMLWGMLLSILRYLRPARSVGPETHPAPAQASSADTRYLSHARVMAGLTMVSRVMGLLREAILARVFGLGWIMDAWVIAFMIPNLFRRLFGEGALAGAFIPHYTRLDQAEPLRARRFAGLVMIWLIALLGLITLFGEGAIAITLGDAHLNERLRLMLELIQTTLPYMPLVCVVAILGAMLQVHGRFGPPAGAPIVLNVAIIAAALYAGHSYPFDHHIDLTGVSISDAANRLAPLSGQTMALTKQQGIHTVAMAVILAGVIQVLWQMWALRRGGHLYLPEGLHLKPTLDDPQITEAMKRLYRQWVPTVLGLAVLQLNALGDLLIATAFSGHGYQTIAWLPGTWSYPLDYGDAATLRMASPLYDIPVGVFAVAVATALFPQLSRAADDRQAFSRLVRHGVRIMLFGAIPATVGLFMIRYELCRTIFYPGGELANNAWTRVGDVLGGYSFGIWAYCLNHLLLRAFYAQHNAKTPMYVALFCVGLNLTLNLLLIWPLGPMGIAYSTGISAAIQSVILMVLLRRYADGPFDRSVRYALGFTALGTLLMAAAIYGLDQFFTHDERSRWQWMGITALYCAIGMLVYGYVAAIFKRPEGPALISRGKMSD